MPTAFVRAVLFVWLVVGGPGAAADADDVRPSILDFELRSLEAPESHRLQRYEGRPVALVIFEPDCTWCRRQVQALNAMQAQCGAGFGAIAVGVNGNRRSLQLELRSVRPDFPAYQASPAFVAAVGGVTGTPVTLLGDANGRFVTWLRGYAPPERLAEALQSAGAGDCGALAPQLR